MSGEVEKKITGDSESAGRSLKASTDNPQYLVKSGRSGKKAGAQAGRTAQEEEMTKGPRVPRSAGRSPSPFVPPFSLPLVCVSRSS
jgi:hypothetical protein